MKKAILLAVFLAAFAGQASAELKTVQGVTPEASNLIQQQQQILTDMKQAVAEWKGANDEVGALNKRFENISWGVEQFKKQVNQYNSAFEAHQRDRAAYEASAADHNRRCQGSFSDHNYVVACNNEIPAGQAWKQRVNTNAANLSQTLAQLQEIQRTTSEETLKVTARMKEVVAQRDAARARYDALKVKLDGVRADVNRCKATITGATREKMHDVCGEMFDGNKSN